MPDTPHNQTAFPQPASQAPGVGFPLLRLCALIDLASGAHGGAGHSELDGSRRTDFRRGLRLGVRDHVVQWCKPAHVPAWMSRARYRAVPAPLTLRGVWVSTRTLCDSHAGSLALLFRLIAQQRVGHRPGRIEPHARKRRPKIPPMAQGPTSCRTTTAPAPRLPS